MLHSLCYVNTGIILKVIDVINYCSTIRNENGIRVAGKSVMVQIFINFE